MQLLEHLCSTEDDAYAYDEFTKRFLPELEAECKKICLARKLDSHIGIQISHDSFERVRRYKSFKRDEVKLPNDRKAILVYLYKIATTLFNDHHRAEKKKEVPNKSYFDDIYQSISKDGAKALKEKKDITLLLLKKLNAKERAVIIKDFEYKKYQKYLPDDVNDSLAQELGVQKNSVRKIRERALKKIKIAIDEINRG